MGCFALGWVVCINRAEFSGVGLYCRLECSCRSGSSLMVVSGVGLVIALLWCGVDFGC